MRVHIDYETRGFVNLTQCGQYVYAAHEATSALIASWAIDDEPFHLWDIIGGEPIPFELKLAMLEPTVKMVAHNASFERVISMAVGPRQGFLPWNVREAIKRPERWSCTAARAASCGLPRALEKVGAALYLPIQKDMDGHHLMMRMCVPCGINENGSFIWVEGPDDRKRLGEYCIRDGEVEREVDKELPELSEFEHAVWCMTERLNDAGIMVDGDMLDHMIPFVSRATDYLNRRIVQLTNAQVPKVTNPSAIAKWLLGYGIDVNGKIGRWVINGLLEEDNLPDIVREVLVLRRDGGKSSTAKFNAIKRRTTSDSRLRGALMYAGAAATSRWSSRGAQVQNLVRNKTVKDIEGAIAAIMDPDVTFTTIEEKYGPPMVVSAELARPLFIAPDDCWLARGDYSQIEARVGAWLARDSAKLQAFRNYDAGVGPDIYIITAAGMYHVHPSEIDKDDPRRQSGKVAELACIAEGELVSTDIGLVPIEHVTTDMRVWDGVEWVRHDGAVFRGEKDCIEYDGLTATEDHQVFVEFSARPIPFRSAAERGFHLRRGRLEREEGWNCGNSNECNNQEVETPSAIFRRRWHTGKMEKNIEHKTRRRVWDILNAGPSHRFTVSGKLVHNCGFGGGKNALLAMARIYNLKLTEDEAEESKVRWREANPLTVQLWYDLEGAALACMRNPPGETFYAGESGISFRQNGVVLAMRLPSGRGLNYWYPKIEPVTTPRGEVRDGITYYAEDSQTHQWSRHKLYGGLICENCLAGDTQVLTHNGWRELTAISGEDLLWDGENWVSHEGVVRQGTKETINFGGVSLTADHKIILGIRKLAAVRTTPEEAAWAFSRYFRMPDGYVDSCEAYSTAAGWWLRVVDGVRVWWDKNNVSARLSWWRRKVLWLQNVIMEVNKRQGTVFDTRYDTTPSVRGLAINDRPMPFTDTSSVSQLWGARNLGVRGMAIRFFNFLARYGSIISTRANTGQRRQQRQLRKEQLPMGDYENTVSEQTKQHSHKHEMGPYSTSRSSETVWCRHNHDTLSAKTWMARRTPAGRTKAEPVYDILNAGPNHRFTVKRSNGEPFLVSNCVQATARDIMAYALVQLDKRGLNPVLTVHDEAVCQVPKSKYPTPDDAANAVLSVMLEAPPFCRGLPIQADGSAAQRYVKG